MSLMKRWRLGNAYDNDQDSRTPSSWSKSASFPGGTATPIAGMFGKGPGILTLAWVLTLLCALQDTVTEAAGILKLRAGSVLARS